MAIITSLTAGFWSVFYTKATALSRGGPWVNIFVGYTTFFIVGWISLAMGWIRNPIEVFDGRWGYLFFFLLYMLTFFLLSPLEQIALKKEKLSTLQPYGNLGKLMSIVCGFVLLGERNIVTFVMSLLAFACTMVYAFRGSKGHRISLGLLYYLGAQIIKGFTYVLIAMILTESHVINFTMSGLELASYESILSILIFFTIFVFTRHLGNFGKNPKAFYRYRYTGSIVGDVSWILGLILVAELGIITSSILSLITMATTLIMGYFFLHDRPEKKDVVFAVFIVILICIGYIFKDVTL